MSSIQGCTSTKSFVSNQEEPLENKYDFPYAAYGYYEGLMETYTADGVTKIPMAMLIDAWIEPNTFQWQIIYNPRTEFADKRRYTLHIKDLKRGHYQLDDDHGVLLDAFLFNNRLVTRYKVGHTALETIHSFEDETIIFEVLGGPAKHISTIEPIKIDSIEIPEINTLKTSTYQRAVLRKIRG